MAQGIVVLTSSSGSCGAAACTLLENVRSLGCNVTLDIQICDVRNRMQRGVLVSGIQVIVPSTMRAIQDAMIYQVSPLFSYLLNLLLTSVSRMSFSKNLLLTIGTAESRPE